ncbi:protein MIZU-KUSSEI 1 [Magnolia sinica]|uniref:protein MIZU-KUSSEI 1 n=1 Tax=Magnolia sinica TaxID=86752 RepID=UPI002657B32E|nr:protein MIZU-KUSSEI 1 [Magnolia sinica]
MRTIMAKTPHDSSFSSSSSRRHFQWRKKKDEEKEEREESLSFNSSSLLNCEDIKIGAPTTASAPRKKIGAGATVAALRIRSVLTGFAAKARWHLSSGLGNRVTGTLFGYRRGHVHFAFQDDPKTGPALLIELATPTSGLVREMASGLVRIALECDRTVEKKGVRLLDEPLWRTYCNGKKCGFAMKRECGPAEWKVLKAVGPVSMGAGVLPGNGAGSEGELMYMRARFERVIGSRDSEAFYMMNPDGNGGPELSIYLLRV